MRPHLIGNGAAKGRGGTNGLDMAGPSGCDGVALAGAGWLAANGIRAMMSLTRPPMLPNYIAHSAIARLRPQVQDIVSENIASLAAEAGPLNGVIPLWYGEGDLPTPAFVRDAAKGALDARRTFYVPDMRGNPELVAALSKYQTRLYGVPIGNDRSTVQPSGMQVMLVALELVCDLGTNVVYVEPQWPNSHNCIHLVGGERRPVPLRLDDAGWHLDLDRLFARCDARTRAILFSSPANPTGWTATREELQTPLDFSQERGIWIIADEVYARLFWAAEAGAVHAGDRRAGGPGAVPPAVFESMGYMTGFRVSWLTHLASVSARVSAITQYMSSGTADFVQMAAAAALRGGEASAGAMRDRCRAGLALAYERLERNPLFRLPPMPAGGMYAFFQVEGWPDSRAACADVLRRARRPGARGAVRGTRQRRTCACASRATRRSLQRRSTGLLAWSDDGPGRRGVTLAHPTQREQPWCI